MSRVLTTTLVSLASAVGIGAAGLAGRYLVLRRRTRGTVRLSEAIPVNSAYWREQRMKHGDLLYVALGDSAAQGIGASLPGRGYVGLLARSIRSTTARTVRVINLAQSGARLREALETQVPAFAKLDPDVVTVAIGANDIGSFSPERFETEVRALFSVLPAFAIVADLPSFYFGDAERRVGVANEIVRRVAAEFDLEVAPLHRATRRRTAARTALRDVAADFFHPNDRGYAVWASAFLSLITAAVSRLSSPAAADR